MIVSFSIKCSLLISNATSEQILKIHEYNYWYKHYKSYVEPKYI